MGSFSSICIYVGCTFVGFALLGFISKIKKTFEPSIREFFYSEWKGGFLGYNNDYVLRLNTEDHTFIFTDSKVNILRKMLSGTEVYNSEGDEISGSFDILNGSFSESKWKIQCIAKSAKHIKDIQMDENGEKFSPQITDIEVKNEYKFLIFEMIDNIVISNDLPIKMQRREFPGQRYFKSKKE
jgi:hypothetical protein